MMTMCLKDYIFRSYHFLLAGNFYLRKIVSPYCHHKSVKVTWNTIVIMSDLSLTDLQAVLDFQKYLVTSPST